MSKKTSYNFIDSIVEKVIKEVRSFLYLTKVEFNEIYDLVNELLGYEPFKYDTAEITNIQNALNIAVVISYARNFKRSNGFTNIFDFPNELIKNFNVQEKELHKKIIKDRDKEFAHSDSSVHDIEVYSENSFSKKRVRQPLDKKQLKILKNMVTKIKIEIEKHIKDVNKVFPIQERYVTKIIL